MAEARNAIHARDSHIWTLRMAFLLMAVMCMVLGMVIYNKQNDFTMHVPPDLSKGAKIKPNELLVPNTYVFAHYTWQQLNEWPVNGKDDYAKKIKEYGCYVTPAFQKWLEANQLQKLNDGELSRTRTITSLRAFSPKFVQVLGNNTFNVTLTMRVTERILEQKTDTPLKEILLLYPLRVVPDNRSCNEMGMALDGFYSQPQRIEEIGKN